MIIACRASVKAARKQPEGKRPRLSSLDTRTWEEVTAVWRIVYMTRQQMKQRKFADWLTVPLDYADKDMKDTDGEAGRKAAVYELWDKATRTAVWFTKSHPKLLDRRGFIS